MTSHRRVKDISYDDNELYSDEEAAYEEDGGYTAEDKQNFADLTPVVQAHLIEADVQASTKEVEEALWHYYWDVAKSVEYLKKQHTKAAPSTQKTAKPKSKFEQAAEKNAGTNDLALPLSSLPSGSDWFAGIPWSNVPEHLTGDLVSLTSSAPVSKLLGGSSKLAKLAEERRKKAAAAKAGLQDTTNQPAVASTLSSLDRLTLNKTEGGETVPVSQARRYPVKKKRETTPPPEPAPEPVVEPKEEGPDLRALPSDFGKTLSISQANTHRSTKASTTAAKPAPATTAPPVLKAKANLPNALDLWKKSRSSQRPFAAFVVAGHVDHGKSTLMGRLLLDTGAVQQRDIDKFRKQAAEIGKESFALAWVMDTGSEERERGVTVDIAQHNFSTAQADFTILDAPGHRDFVPSMISGASMADIVVLVVDANQLESGLKGQTREHIQLAYGVGIRKVIVAVNKLDVANPPWHQALFDDVKDQIQRLLRQVGFTEKNMRFVPCSGLNGETVAKPAAEDSPAAQIKGDAASLVAALEALTHDDAKHYQEGKNTATIQEKAITSRPLRMQVADVYRGGVQNPLTVSGRITSGTIVAGQLVVIQPSGDQAVVKGIELAGEPKDWAVALQIVAVHLDGDIETLNRNFRTGDLICASDKPAKLIKTITVKVQVLETILPQAVELHFGRLHLAASVRRLVETIDAKGAQLKKSPRSLKPGQLARVEIAIDTAAALEATDRIVLRSDGSTIAFGIIESVVS